MGNASSLKHHVETAEKTGVIQLSKSNLRDLPRDLLSISDKLRTLDLNTNRLQQIGDNIATFKNLKILNLGHNKIRLLSSSIGLLTRLESLILEDNQLEQLPNELSKLESLKTLNLSTNKFRTFPVQTIQLKNLELLDLSNNQISAIPNEIGQCNATEINLNNNKLTRLHDSLANCQRLKVLRFDNNQVELSSVTRPILADSKICLLSYEKNPFILKQLQDRDGYEEYSSRFTSTKRKMI